MNGQQIENILLLIDGNVQITRAEAADYIRNHQAEIVSSLRETGVATVPTSAGGLKITVDDLKNLEAAAA